MSQPYTEYRKLFGAYVALLDQLVFLVDGAGVPQKQRGILWPVDYDNNDDVRQNRVPAENPRFFGCMSFRGVLLPKDT